jgi:3-phosphoshikimate 1-carboxyvinyltransferase
VTVARVAPGTVAGTVRAPSSKSYTHRALVAGHLRNARYTVMRPLDAEDTRSTARALGRLGSKLHFSAERWTLSPGSPRSARLTSVDCGESGTTLRFVAAVAARSSRRVRLQGQGKLPGRPMRELFHALETLGATCEVSGRARSLPAIVSGPIHGGVLRLDASRSSQFASSLLLTLPTVSGDSNLELVGPIVSEPYIDATLAVLRHHRVRVNRSGRHFSIPGDQKYRGRSIVIPGDASSAAYFWAAGAITRGRVEVTGVPTDCPQADLAVLDLLRSAGATVRRSPNGATVEGGELRGFTVDLTRAPDLYPLAGVLAASIPEESRILGAPHVVHKESNRREGTALLARAMGARVREQRSGLSIRGSARPTRLRLRGLADHRLVMSAAVGALVGDGISSVDDARAVRKSFPGFWQAFGSLRTEVTR